MVRINTFGVSEMQRLGLPDRQHRGFPRPGRLKPVEIYNAIRGCTIAADAAFDEGSLDDLRLSLARAQVLAAELLSRVPGHKRLALLESDADPVADTRPANRQTPKRQGAKSAKKKAATKRKAKGRTKRKRPK